jgi:hypothetical protein
MRPNGHAHQTIGEAGDCPECRRYNVELISDLPHRYLLAFPEVDAIAVVPALDLDTAVDNAWATGCNPGGHLGGQELPADLVEQAGVPLCILLTGTAKEAARDALKAAGRDLGYMR